MACNTQKSRLVNSSLTQQVQYMNDSTKTYPYEYWDLVVSDVWSCNDRTLIRTGTYWVTCFVWVTGRTTLCPARPGCTTRLRSSNMWRVRDVAVTRANRQETLKCLLYFWGTILKSAWETEQTFEDSPLMLQSTQMNIYGCINVFIDRMYSIAIWGRKPDEVIYHARPLS